MLLCQIEMRSLENTERTPAYYIVGRYGFDPGLQAKEDVWINWQIAEHDFEIKTQVISRRKEVYVDGESIVRKMNDVEKAKFSAIYPNGVQSLREGASLFLIRIFVEATDKEALFKIQAAMSKGEKILSGVKQLPNAH